MALIVQPKNCTIRFEERENSAAYPGILKAIREAVDDSVFFVLT